MKCVITYVIGQGLKRTLNELFTSTMRTGTLKLILGIQGTFGQNDNF